jgi:hypothetical protein
MIVTKEHDHRRNETYYLAMVTCKYTGRQIIAEGYTRAGAMSSAYVQSTINRVSQGQKEFLTW